MNKRKIITSGIIICAAILIALLITLHYLTPKLVNIDIVNKKVDLKVLVAPLKTVDFIIKNTPIVGGILGGTLVSIPVRVKGDLSNPNISYLSASTAGSRLLDIMKNALHAPVKIIEPIAPGKREKE
jgi:hypothetical protein